MLAFETTRITYQVTEPRAQQPGAAPPCGRQRGGRHARRQVGRDPQVPEALGARARLELLHERVHRPAALGRGQLLPQAHAPLHTPARLGNEFAVSSIKSGQLAFVQHMHECIVQSRFRE